MGNNKGWKNANGNGYITPQGYRMVRMNGKRGLEHRFVMESHVGRHLLPTEHVHHINENRLDNRLENLELCANQSEHNHRHRHFFRSKTHKQCSECSHILPRECFYLRKINDNRDTHQATCKKCQLIRKKRSYHKTHADTIKLPTFRNETHKECSSCHEIKERSAFGLCKNPRAKDPNNSHCRFCDAQMHRNKRRDQGIGPFICKDGSELPYRPRN